MIYSISDLHLGNCVDKPMDVFGKQWEGHFDKIKKDWQQVTCDDIVLISGDISWAMSLEDAKSDFDAISALNGTKIILRGNHDYWWTSLKKLSETLPKNIIPVQNNCVRVKDNLFCGSRGWTLEQKTDEDEKIFSRELLRLELSLQAMDKVRTPQDTVVGMTHFPPFDVSLTETPITKLFSKYGVEKVVYGHLHGDCYVKKHVFIKKTEYYLTSCDLVDYKLVKIV